MKKALTQTIIVFVAVNLITAGFALAQNVTEEEIQPASKEAVVAEKEIELERKKAEIEVKVAEKKTVAEVARQQFEVAQKQMEAAQKQMGAAQQQMAMKMNMYDILEDYRAPRLSLSPWQQRDGGEVLVIPTAQMKLEDLATITEDMNVMSRIFAKKLSQAHLTTGRASLFVGLAPFSGHNSGTIEAIYLEDYGALFLMKVNFPLSPPPEAPEEKETEEEDTDPLWTQMRQEIYAPEEARRSRTDDRPEEKYDVKKVAELKETLIKTLKHAANIRALKPDQSVILTVIGGRSQSTATVIQSSVFSGRRRSTGDSRTRTVRIEPGAETGSFLPTVLTICAKKSDIDAFAKGELSFDQFRERTRIFTSYAKVGKEGSPGVEGRPVAHEGHSVF